MTSLSTSKKWCVLTLVARFVVLLVASYPSKFIRFLNKYLIENNNIGSNNNNIGINNNIYCSICLDSLDSFYSNKNIIKLDCNHIFHYDCFLPWIESGNKTCPLCRNTFSI